MGSYLFANQYQNTVIPEDEKKFKPEWLRYYTTLPKVVYNFAFIDPAIGQKKKSDYTAIAVVAVDPDANWYLRVANRYRLTPTQIISKMFDLHAEFNLQGLGVESQAFQEALLYFSDDEMKRRQKVLPLVGIKRTNEDHKITRIQSMVPRFEWGRAFVAQGMTDFEDEYNLFPRASHDDILDAIQSIEDIVFYPEHEKEKVLEQPHSPHDPNFERWAVQQLARRASEGEE